VSRWLLLAFAVAACRDRSTAPPPKATPARDGGVAAVAAPAAAVVRKGAQAPVPGSWPYVTVLSRCVVQLRPAPPDEVGKTHEIAKERLAALGDDLVIEMSALGDHVSDVDIGQGHAAAKPPRSTAEVKALATAALTTYADVFGLAADEPARLHPRVKRVTDIPGTAWELTATLERNPTGPMPVRTGSGDIVVEIARDGSIVMISVDDELLPPLTVCDDTMTPQRLETVVVGRELHWTGESGRTSEGTITAEDISETARRIMRVRGSALDDNLVVGAVYQVQINHDYLPWTLIVDPAAGVVIETTEL
jgi:hypothetical protein